jgi:hypothetical protein
VSIESLRQQFREAFKRFPYFPVWILEKEETDDDYPDPETMRPAVRPVKKEDGTIVPVFVRVPRVAPEAKAHLKELVAKGYPILREHGVNLDEVPGKTDEARWLVWALRLTEHPAVGAWCNAPVNKQTNPTEYYGDDTNVFRLIWLALGELRNRQFLGTVFHVARCGKEVRALELLLEQCWEYHRTGRKINVNEIAETVNMKRTTLMSRPGFKWMHDALTGKGPVVTRRVVKRSVATTSVATAAELTTIPKGRTYQKTRRNKRGRKRSSP